MTSGHPTNYTTLTDVTGCDLTVARKSFHLLIPDREICHRSVPLILDELIGFTKNSIGKPNGRMP